jgi:hypothetical protein
MHEITSLISSATHSRQRVGAIAQGGVGAQTKEPPIRLARAVPARNRLFSAPTGGADKNGTEVDQ